MAQLQEHIAHIDRKDTFYRGVLAGEIPYRSNLLDTRPSDQASCGV